MRRTWTTGASNDIQQATNLARRMVTEFGMSDRLGRVRYSATDQEMFLGSGGVQASRNVSSDTARIIDEEVRRLIEEAEQRARNLLIEHMDNLHKVSKALLEYETLSGDEVRALVRGESISRDGEGGSGGRYVAATRPSSGRRLGVPASNPGAFGPEPQQG